MDGRRSRPQTIACPSRSAPRQERLASPPEHYRLSRLVDVDVAEDPRQGRRLKAYASVVGVVRRGVDSLASDCDLRRKGLRIPRHTDFVVLIPAALHNLDSTCPELEGIAAVVQPIGDGKGYFL